VGEHGGINKEGILSFGGGVQKKKSKPNSTLLAFHKMRGHGSYSSRGIVVNYNQKRLAWGKKKQTTGTQSSAKKRYGQHLLLPPELMKTRMMLLVEVKKKKNTKVLPT